MVDNPIKTFLAGKKTYAVAIAATVVGILNHNGIDVPEYVWSILAGAGLAFLRAGVNKVNDLPTD
jgi:hypothetical protein